MKAIYQRRLKITAKGGTIVGTPRWKLDRFAARHHKLKVAPDGMSAVLTSDTRAMPKIHVTADGSDGRKHRVS